MTEQFYLVTISSDEETMEIICKDAHPRLDNTKLFFLNNFNIPMKIKAKEIKELITGRVLTEIDYFIPESLHSYGELQFKWRDTKSISLEEASEYLKELQSSDEKLDDYKSTLERIEFINKQNYIKEQYLKFEERRQSNIRTRQLGKQIKRSVRKTR